MSKTMINKHPRDAIPRNIKILLAAQGHNQAWLAERMKVTRATVSNWMIGRAVMGIDSLDRIAEILHTTPAKLYTAPEETAENCMRLIV